MIFLGRISQFFTRWPKLASLLLGALAATGFPPLHAWPITIASIAVLAMLVFHAENWRRAALLGWWFGVGHFTLANNWIATAFTFQAEMPTSLGWLAVPLLALYLAVFPAMAAGLARICADKIGADGIGSRRVGPGRVGPSRLDPSRLDGAGFVFLFAGFWIVTEWMRSWVFTGYAWDPLGLTLLGMWDRPGLAIILPWTGTYALSGIAIMLGGLVWHLIARKRYLGAGILAGLVAAGMLLPEMRTEREGNLAFTLVQPDIRQDELDDPSKFEGQFMRTAGLSAKRRKGGKRLLLWPESGVPDYLRDGYPQRYYNQMTVEGDPAYARFRLGKVAGDNGLLLTGAVDLEIRNGKAAGARNAVTAINSEGRIVAGYDKAHLVPYGEYLALRWLLEPLGATRLVAGSIDFWPGPGAQTLDLGEWGQAGVQICYEIVFSGEVADADNRPDYIFNPSNDGWFGSWGPPQHLAQARMRAIEEGLPVLRSTTTGISAVIDSNGIIRSTIGQHRAARIDGFVPPANAPTLFSKLGNWLPLGWAILAIAASLVATRLRRS